MLIFLIPFFVVLFSTPFFRKQAVKFNILDMPGKRKIHTTPTPLLGGLAVYLGVMSGLLYGLEYSKYLLGLMIGATIILVLGIFDDARGLSAQFRLLIQLLASLIMVSFGIHLTLAPGQLWGYLFNIALTLIWMIGITNSMNYLDGIDGLAAGIAAISGLFFSIIAYQTGQSFITVAGVVIMASALAYLPHNFSKNKIFLGDAGSTFLGFTLAGVAVIGNWAEDNVVKITVPILILAIPIFDMVFTTIMRIREKKVSTIIEWLKYGGKDHFHHRLVHLGIFPAKAMVFICLISISFGINAVMVSNEEAFVGILSILQATIIFAGIAVLMVIGRRRPGH